METRLEHAPCGYLSFRDDGTVTAVNRTLCELLGYRADEVEGDHVQRLFTAGTRIFYQTHLFPLLRLHGRADEIFATLRTKAGQEIGVLMNAVRAGPEGEEETSAIVVPILRRKLFEEELLRAKRDAEAANRVKARFLSTVSHDLRTPLSAVLGFAELLDAEIVGPLGDKQREAVNAIRRAATYLVGLVDALLNYVTVESGAVRLSLERVDVGDVVSESARLVRGRFENAKVGLVVEPAAAFGLASDAAAAALPLCAHADAGRLQQILLNLLTNGAKFTPSGGRVAVRGRLDGAWVRIDVEDTGPGIAEDDRERIFGAFERGASESPEGVGLGLSISRELARAMGGDVTVTSEPGSGATFTVSLRAAEVAPDAASGAHGGPDPVRDPAKGIDEAGLLSDPANDAGEAAFEPG